jgi:hypothetical protein
MSRFTSFLMLSGLVLACTETPVGPAGTSNVGLVEQSSSADNRVTHRVSAGGADICTSFGDPPGCDANWSLVAVMRADGSVSGQWQDVLAYGFDQPIPVHASLDCLSVDGNEAWVSGVVTSPAWLAGYPVLARMVDGGPLGPDLHSFLWEDIFDGCTTQSEVPDLLATDGQVIIW